MKHQKAIIPSILAGVLVGLGLLQTAPASAAEYPQPVLAVDLDPSRLPDPLDPQLLTVLGNRLYFTGDNPETGREPWVSDGTAAGTRLFEDLCPGPCSSAVAGFGEIGGQLVMVIQVGNETRLLKEVGGELETVVVLPGATGSFFQLGNQVFFSFNEAPRPDLVYGRTTLMASDGTAAGTVAATTLCSGPVCGSTFSFTKLGDAVYLFASNASVGTDIKRVTAGQPVQTIASFGQFVGVSSLRALDAQRIVFRTAYFLDFFDTPWIYGPGTGSRAIDAAGNFTSAERNGFFVTWRGRLYYRNLEGAAVTTNGNAGDLRYATELTGPSPVAIGSTPNRLYYVTGGSLRVRRADNTDQVLISGGGTYSLSGQWGDRALIRRDARLYATDGTLAGTALLPAVTVHQGVPFAGVFYFSGSRPNESGWSLWRTDGSAAGTYEIAVDSTGPASSGARPYAVGGKLIVDTPAAGEQRRLWRVDPETFAAAPISSSALVPLANNGSVLLAQDPETRQVYAVREAGPPLALPSTDIVQSFGSRVAVAPDGRFFFTDYSDGQELWESDGTVAGTRELFDLDPGWTNPCNPGEECYLEMPGAITPAGNRVFFVASTPGGPQWPGSLWVYDRGTGQKRRVPLPQEDFDLWPVTELVAVGSQVVFASTDTQPAHRELWRTDGVNSSPFFATDGTIDSKVAVGGRLFFRVAGGQLWVSDMTPEGTRQLLSLTTFINNLVRVGDHLFFTYQAENGEMRLGWSDGTPAGTSSVARPGLPLFASLDELFATGDHRLVFAAQVETTGKDHFISDGTAERTRQVGDPGDPEPSPIHFAQIGNRLFFQGGDIHSGRELWAVDLPAPSPACPAGKLCLDEGRFEVSVEVRAPDGVVRQGQRALATSESGVFTFFGPDNWEFLVKVLDGCGYNGHFWVYAAAATDVAYILRVLDRATGATRTYANSPGQAARPILDSVAFAGCSAETPAPLHSPVSAPAPIARRCGDDLEDLCLGGRFRVAATWRTATATGKAHAIADGSEDSGLFSFFSPSNWELMVKVLDGCALNGKHWIFAAGTTDVGFTLRVEDLETGQVKVYENALGNPAVAITDTGALGGCD